MRQEGRKGNTYGGRRFRGALLCSRRLGGLVGVLCWLEAQAAGVLTRSLRRLRSNGARSTSSLLRITGSISRRGSSPGSDRLDSVDHVVGCLGLGPRKPSCYILSRRALSHVWELISHVWEHSITGCRRRPTRIPHSTQMDKSTSRDEKNPAQLQLPIPRKNCFSI